MIRLDTPRNLYRYECTIAVHCPACNRWDELALEDLQKVADRPIVALKFRCQECGGPGEKQVRPPTPKVDRLYRQ